MNAQASLGTATLRWTAIALVGLLATPLAHALEDSRFRAPGKATIAGREFPAHVRVLCSGPKDIEVQLAVIFASGAEAAGSDVFFPFGEFEGPDGKPAPIAIDVTSAQGRSSKHRFTSAAGWFGVENEYLFSLRPADGKRFLGEGATARAITASIVAGKSSIAFTFPDPAQVLGKAAEACRLR